MARPWIFVLGRRFVVALPTHADPALAGRIAALSEAEVSIERLVALIPLGGPHAVDSFAAVAMGPAGGEDGSPISAIVRGELAVEVYSVGGSRSFTDRGVRPWLLADFHAVTALTIGSAGSPAAAIAELGLGAPAATGIVTGARLDWLSGPAAEASRFSTVAAVPPLLVEDTVLSSTARAEDTVLRAFADDTVLASGITAEDTVLASGTTAEDTILREQPSGSDTSNASAPDAAQPPARAFSFRIGQDDPLPLDAVYLIGRSPREPRVTPSRPVRLLSVASPSRQVSSTHLELRTEGEAVVVTDLRSTNGTLIEPPRGRRLRLRPGESMVVVPGTRVAIGDGTIVTIFAEDGPAAGRPTATRRPTT